MRARIRPFHFGVGLLAGCLLACELLLLRLFRIAHGSEFTEIAISIALLGFGASGTLLTLGRGFARRRARAIAVICAPLSGIALLGAYAIGQSITLRPGFLVWGGGEVRRLLLWTLPLILPFLLGGIALGIVFLRWPRQTRSLYAFNLLGSGVGALGLYLLLFAMRPEDALLLIAILCALAGVLMAWRWRLRLVLGGTALMIAGVAALALAPLPDVRLSDFKPLEIIRSFPDARTLQTIHHPAGRVDVVASSAFHHAPGASLQSAPSDVTQAAVFLDGDLAGSLQRGEPAAGWEGRPQEASTAPWMMTQVIGNHQAWLADFSDEIELRRLLASHHMQTLLLSQPNGALRAIFGQEVPSANLYGFSASVDWRDDAALTILRQGVPLPGAPLLVAISQGRSALAEDHLRTEVGLRLVAKDLPWAVFAIPVDHPPRASLRLLALICEAARNRFGDDAARHVVALRGHSQLAVMLSVEPMEAPRQFADRWDFDLVWAHDMEPSEANQHHVLDEPIYHETARRILAGDLDAVAEEYSFELRPPTAWRPFLWQPFKPADVWALLIGQRPAGLETIPEANILLALAVKLRALAVVAALLILLPLITLIGRASGVRSSRALTVVYFASLGFGFLMLELFVLFLARRALDSPVLAASVTIGGFLLASGVGSLVARRRRGLFVAIIALALVATLLFEALVRLGMGLPLPARALWALIALAPMAFAMGMPFPLGLSAIGRRGSALVPWAWGINGFASVLAAPLATLFALTGGWEVVLLCGLGCYAIAGLCARWLLR